MEVWQEIAKNAEHGAERLVAEYGDRLYAAATLLCRNNGDAEELVFTRDLPVIVLLTLSIGILGFNRRNPRSSSTITRLCGIIWLAAFLAYLFLLFRQEAFTNFVRRGE